ncbi:hypothetical protein ACHWQZ_G016119 [Mnemiopsis leidyi]
MDEDDDNTLQFENGKVVAGSINDLIGHLTPTSEYYPTEEYLFAFISSCRLFVDPIDVLKQVVERCQIEQSNPDLPETATVAPHLLLFILQWTETFPNDFNRPVLMEKLHEARRFCQNIDPSCSRGCNRLIQMLDNRLTDVKTKKKVPKSESWEDVNFVRDIKPELIAAQLTHIELDFLNNISCDEMITMLGKDLASDSICLNVNKYVNWFNHLSHFVASAVLAPELGGARHLTMEYYMDVAVACFSVGNFNSAMSVLAGLSQSSITRLHKLREKVDKNKADHLATLEKQMSPSENFKTYRAALKNALKQHTCVIPFFTLLVKDIHTTCEIKKTKVEGTELINFEKCWELAGHLVEFQKYQSGVCDLQSDGNIQEDILVAKILTEDGMMFSSYEIEEPVTVNDKKRYKAFLEKAPTQRMESFY